MQEHVAQIPKAPRGRHYECDIFISGYSFMRISGDAAQALGLTDDDKIMIGKIGDQLFIAKAPDAENVQAHNLTKSYYASRRTRTLLSYSATYSRFAGGYAIYRAPLVQRMLNHRIVWWKLVKTITPY